MTVLFIYVYIYCISFNELFTLNFSIVLAFTMETRQSFYVYLNSNEDIFNVNLKNPTNFTNSIKPCLCLSDDYEVGLVNIMFKSDFIQIKKGDENYGITVKVKFPNASEKKKYKLKDFTIRYTPQIDIISDDMSDLITKFNQDFMSFLIVGKFIDRNHTDIFSFSGKDTFSTLNFDIKLVNFQKLEHSITITSALKVRELIGISNTGFVQPKLPREIHTVNIYSDIVEPSYIGRQSVHILDLIPMKGIYSKTGTLTTYKPVNITTIDNISFKLTDQLGEDLPFSENVVVTAILHFRQIS